MSKPREVVLGREEGCRRPTLSFLDLPERMQIRLEPEPNTGCWIWIGANASGRGLMYYNGRQRYVCRVTFEMAKGSPIIPGYDIDHLCRNPTCANPGHLRECTRRQNVLAPGSLCLAAAQSKQEACIRGHQFTPENTYNPPYSPRMRRCRTCHNAWGRKNYAIKGRPNRVRRRPDPPKRKRGKP